MSFFTRFRTPIYQNTGSVARDHLASERTFLSWIRTGLGFIALGIAVERFSQLDLESLVEQLKPSTSSEQGGQPQQQQNLDERRQKRSHEKAKEQALVGMLLGTGAGSIVYGVARYFTTMRMLERGLFKPAYYGTAGLAVIVAGMAGGSYWSTLRREESRMEGYEEGKRKGSRIR